MADTYSDTELVSADEFRDSENARMDTKLWRRLFNYVLHYKGHLAVVAICGGVLGVTEMAFGLVTKWLVDDIQANGLDASLGTWTLLIVIASVISSVMIIGFVFLVSKLRAMASYDIRMDAFVNIQEQSFGFFDKRPVGWLMARLTSDCERLTDILTWAFLDFVWGTAMMLSMGTVMLILNWKLALCAFALLPMIGWVTVKFRRSILQTAREVRSTNSLITGSFNESISGVLTSKSFVKETENLKQFSQQTNRLYSSSVKNLTLSAVYMPIMMTVGSIATGLTIAVGGVDFLNGAIVAGTLIAFMSWMRFFFEPVVEMAHWFTEMQTAQASAERILAVMDAVPAIDAGGRVNPPEGNIIGSIEIRNVSFAYNPPETVLSEISLKAVAGETVALVGPTGGGKTTFANIVCRFYEPTSGHVFVNGIDYRQFPLRWFRSQLGVVLQHPHVFSGSILENIRYGKPNAEDWEVYAAARTAGAHEFIEQMPESYKTEAGAGGSKLSAGQKQLISIARAVLADPQVLILDEATSSVDTATEQHIQQGLENLLQNRLCFVIAHRLSTIRNATKIAFIRSGRVAEFGTHRELLRLDGLYADLYRQQSLRESIESSFDLADKTRNEVVHAGSALKQ
ncbi:MAG: ABC transporter ATP-binding protein [Gammaproteobacteria bacterium]|nr:ABC transporter ATP-binding protein [Gammaproteobacteria bacterium]